MILLKERLKEEEILNLLVQMNCKSVIRHIKFMPLTSANYSGGIIITDWYSDNNNPNETIKITIRFLSNEIRADAIDINVFYKKCTSVSNCVVQKDNKSIESELRKEILKKATLYQRQAKEKNKSFYPTPKVGGGS